MQVTKRERQRLMPGAGELPTSEVARFLQEHLDKAMQARTPDETELASMYSMFAVALPHAINNNTCPVHPSHDMA